MGFFGFGKKKEKEQQSAQAEETRLEAQADETSGAENAQAPAGDAEQAAQDEKKQGLFSRLWQGLSKTRGNVAGRVDELIEATETIDEDFYEDLVDILIMSDMGVRTSDKVIQELKTRVARERITDAKKAREILKDILKEIMGMPRKPLKWPMVMLVVGVNGVGKTTTIGKLAMRFKDARHSVVLAAAVLMLFVLFSRRIFAVTFDETFARATGGQAEACNMLLALLTAVTIVLGMRVMGTMLISSLIIFPALTAMRVCRSFKSVTLCAAAVSVVCFFVGLCASYLLSTAAGATVVVANILAFLIFAAVGRLRG